MLVFDPGVWPGIWLPGRGEFSACLREQNVYGSPPGARCTRPLSARGADQHRRLRLGASGERRRKSAITVGSPAGDNRSRTSSSASPPTPVLALPDPDFRPVSSERDHPYTPLSAHTYGTAPGWCFFFLSFFLSFCGPRDPSPRLLFLFCTPLLMSRSYFLRLDSSGYHLRSGVCTFTASPLVAR